VNSCIVDREEVPAKKSLRASAETSFSSTTVQYFLQRILIPKLIPSTPRSLAAWRKQGKNVCPFCRKDILEVAIVKVDAYVSSRHNSVIGLIPGVRYARGL
jgi:hypothetical protein